ncbi:MAG: hemin receptor [Verrucomicrobia bacterium]|nr:hemin receptor [Verrucomicrobiota bacterium]
MTQKEKQLVQESWARVIPISDIAANLFYEQLFKLDPSLRALFTSDISEQGRKLMAMITIAVNGLENLEKILPAVRALGSRHAGYGVKDEHYETVASALLWTLEQGLGDAFTEDTRFAWIATYTLISNTMKDAAAELGTLQRRSFLAERDKEEDDR